jgi:iron complex outermembrane receptor protein
MRHLHWIHWMLLAPALSFPVPGLAQPSTAPEEEIATDARETPALDAAGEPVELGDLEIEETFEPAPALQEFVSVATKYTLPSTRTPASLVVISRDDLQAAGHRSIGEALAWVPGAFTSYDLVTSHVGLRGLFGGSRSGSRTLRIMIDGRAVPLVHFGTYLLGPEFVPIGIVERIEVMRGPASALYGAGALTGAVNVVTRRPSYDGSTTVDGHVAALGSVLGQRSVGGEGAVTVTAERAFALAAVSALRSDRSGMRLPASSPLQSQLAAAGERSEDDLSQTLSLFGRADAPLAGGRIWALALGQLPDSVAEFNDLTVLSHDTRISLYSFSGATGWERPFASGLAVRGTVGFATGGVRSADRFTFSAERLTRTRDLSSSELTGTLEVLREFGEAGFVLGGVDGQLDRERASRITSRDSESGELLQEGEAPDGHLVQNLGLFAQAMVPLSAAMLMAGGVRIDANSATELALSARAGLVLTPIEQLALKLLAGRAYKAPSAEQLYGNPIHHGDVEGNPDLPAQYYSNVELTADVFPTTTLRLSASAFYGYSTEGLTYLARGARFEPTAFDAETVGGELVVRHVTQWGRAIETDLSASVAVQHTRTNEALVGGIVDKAVPDDELYPQAIVRVVARVANPATRLGLRVGWRWVGERIPSQSNLRLHPEGWADPRRIPYTLPSYHVVDVTLTFGPWGPERGPRATAQLVLENALDSEIVEAGFGGVDVPGLGRTAWARVQLDF